MSALAEDFEAERLRRMAAILSSDPGQYLSPEERARYEDAQRSVVEARRSAVLVEGERWIA